MSIQSRFLKNTKVNQPKIEMQDKKNPPKNEKKIEREREREVIFLCGNWESYV